MKKLLVVFAVMLCACNKPEYSSNVSTGIKSRFVIIEDNIHWRVVYDRETLVMYAVSSETYNYGTFTLLVDAEGKPLKWKGGRE